jgi:hypothetical protein
MTGEGNPLKRLVPKTSWEGIREKCDDRVVGGRVGCSYIDDVIYD